MINKRNITRQVAINSGVSSDFIESTLTQDITTLEALYDLVDNSIDAARNHIMQGKYVKDVSGLPSSYEGYKIHIRIDKNSVRIIDNCLGIDEKTLTKSALYTAATSNHPYGIGYYGLGLKRALLKMGTHFSFSIDNGTSIFKTAFTNKHIGGNSDKEILANEYATKGRKKVLFSVTDIKSEISNDLLDSRWFENATNGFSVRYSIYLSKGFQIILHNVSNAQFKRIVGTTPALRNNALVDPIERSLNINGVDIFIESGIHEEYIFPGETGYSLKKNRELTDYFGIYFVCNDRIIVAASTAKEHGWGTKWHSEYNGFVCWVKFISREPHNLPWNTAKTALRVDSSLFLKVRDIIKPIADQYRSEIKNRYPSKNKNGNNVDVHVNNTNFPNILVQSNLDTSTQLVVVPNDKNAFPSKSNERNDVVPPVPTTPASNAKPKLPRNSELSRNRNVLVDWDNCGVIVPQKRIKEFHVFVELCSLNSKASPIACVVMLRVFLEMTVKQVSLTLGLKWKNLSKSSMDVANNLYQQNYLLHPVKELVVQYSNTEGGLFSFNNIQSHVHSTKFHPSQPIANTYWDELEPFLSCCWRYLIAKDSESIQSHPAPTKETDAGA